MRYLDEERKPKVLGVKSLAVALAIHVGFGLLLWGLGEFDFKPKETVIPIELTVVLPPNPDGDKTIQPKREDALPPEPEPPKPEPPKPDPPKPEPPKPKEDEPVRQEVVEQVKAKTNAVAKVEQKKAKPQEKTAKQLRDERLAAMRSRTKPVSNRNPNRSRNSKPSNAYAPPTDRPITELSKIPDYFKAGTEEKLASGEEQRCVSLIYTAYYGAWNRPAYSASLRVAELQVDFDMGGRVVNYRLIKSFGSKAADDSVLAAARKVRRVNGLSSAFLKNSGRQAVIKFNVTPE